VSDESEMNTEKVIGSGLSGEIFNPDLNNLMTFKVRRVLLVASLYDYFMLEEDGRLVDLLGQDYNEHNLGYVPMLYRADDGASALKEIQSQDFDLVITVMHLKDMDTFRFGRQAKRIKPDLPVIMLAYNTPELQQIMESADPSDIDRVFVWQGDGKILIGIIKYVEDMKNAKRDNELAGVQSILLVEDSVQFYSKYLYTIYDELWHQIERLLKENMTYTQKKARQKKRPKVLLATNYEEAMELYNSFSGYLMGVITDISYPIAGKKDPEAGLKFAKFLRNEQPNLPILIQSSEINKKKEAAAINAAYLDKFSPTLLEDFRGFLNELFLFNMLIIKDEQSGALASANDIRSLIKAISRVSDDVLKESFEKGLIIRWLKARADLALAAKIEEVFRNGGGADLKKNLFDTIIKHQRESYRGSISRYSNEVFKSFSGFCKIGEGSIGGKGRGLAFIDRILSVYFNPSEFPDVNISIPPTVVIGTDIFDEFLAKNNLQKFAIDEDHTDDEITARFTESILPDELENNLELLIRQMDSPLAVRSSSLLEDTLYQPFAGIFITQMLPNNEEDVMDRLDRLRNAIKLVYASTFFKQARSYIENTSNRIEDEKMAVVIQEVIGRSHNRHYYPDFSGVARSYNYYPFGGAKPEDGTTNLALGLGKAVVDGGATIRYTPIFPGVLPQFSNNQDLLSNSQKDFWAINLGKFEGDGVDKEDQFLAKLAIDEAEKDGVLDFIASTYSWDNDVLYDGIGREGPRVITFAHILKNEVMPLSKILMRLLDLGEMAMGCPIEMEFAVNLDPQRALPADFAFLQMRPIVDKNELVEIRFEDYVKSSMLCCSHSVLGNGLITDIKDIVFVRPEKFDASKTPQIAEEVDYFNKKLKEQQKPYLLAGPGRWGSTESWLGIPVKWGQIDNAKVIVEAALATMNPDPSQGSHFFQNITSLRIGYFTVPLQSENNFVDWDWLQQQKEAEETEFVRHLTLDSSARVLIDGRKGEGIILKPDIRGVISLLFPI
jgi:CheY-like chemotaxis protein